MINPAQMMGAAGAPGAGGGKPPGGGPAGAPAAEGAPPGGGEAGSGGPGAAAAAAQSEAPAGGERQGPGSGQERRAEAPAGLPDDLMIPQDDGEGDRQHIGHEDFLELMMVQLQNQDPMDPTSTDEFMGQIAQFTTASGVDQLQRDFNKFFEHMRSDQSLRASALVGREVITEGREGVLREDGGMEAILDLDESVSNLTISIENSAGERVYREQKGEQPEGEQVFQWDGRDQDGNRQPAGNYRISAYVEDGDDRRDVTTLVGAPVTSVTLGKDGQEPRLNVAGLGEVSLADVQRVR